VALNGIEVLFDLSQPMLNPGQAGVHPIKASINPVDGRLGVVDDPGDLIDLSRNRACQTLFLLGCLGTGTSGPPKDLSADPDADGGASFAVAHEWIQRIIAEGLVRPIETKDGDLKRL
jgi:hypothetical protein